jgi:hypothetical protein
VTAFICITCGTQFPPAASAPAECPVCSDSRQYVGLDGQQWTTLDALRDTHRNVMLAEESSVHSIHTQPGFAIGQRAFLIATPQGNVLWDCITLLDPPVIEAVGRLGGIAAIAISHPHYYTTMIEWSRQFDHAPIYLHEADRQWVMRPDPVIRYWSGASLELPGALTLVHTPGHFAGYQVLHWAAGAGGQGVLFSGDQPQVCLDTRWVSFMYSYPNYIPLGPGAVTDIVARLDPYPFDRIYGAFPKRTVASNAQAILKNSAARYLQAIRP